MDWKPIATAARDHRTVQGWNEDGWIPMMYLSQSGDWKQVNPMNPMDTDSIFGVRKPTHWAPLPDGPVAGSIGDQRGDA